MRSQTHSHSAPDLAPADDLTRLLTSEQAIAARIERVRVESEGIVRAAREDAARIEAEVAATIAQKLTAVEKEHEVVLAEDLRQIHEAASATVSRFDNIGDNELQELAAYVLSLVLPMPAEQR